MNSGFDLQSLVRYTLVVFDRFRPDSIKILVDIELGRVNLGIFFWEPEHLESIAVETRWGRVLEMDAAEREMRPL
jgi:hypothetical protein